MLSDPDEMTIGDNEYSNNEPTVSLKKRRHRLLILNRLIMKMLPELNHHKIAIEARICMHCRGHTYVSLLDFAFLFICRIVSREARRGASKTMTTSAWFAIANFEITINFEYYLASIASTRIACRNGSLQKSLVIMERPKSSSTWRAHAAKNQRLR